MTSCSVFFFGRMVPETAEEEALVCCCFGGRYRLTALNTDKLN